MWSVRTETARSYVFIYLQKNEPRKLPIGSLRRNIIILKAEPPVECLMSTKTQCVQNSSTWFCFVTEEAKAKTLCHFLPGKLSILKFLFNSYAFYYLRFTYFLTLLANTALHVKFKRWLITISNFFALKHCLKHSRRRLLTLTEPPKYMPHPSISTTCFMKELHTPPSHHFLLNHMDILF